MDEGHAVGLGRQEAGTEEDIGHTGIVALQEAHQDLGHVAAVGDVDPAHDAEIERHDGPVGIDQDIAGVHVSVKEAVAKHLIEEHLGSVLHDLVGIEPGPEESCPVGGMGTGDAFHGEDPPTGPLPIHSRHAKALIVAAVFRQLDRSRRLEPQIELAAGRSGKDGHRLDRLVMAKMRLRALHQPRQPAEEDQIPLDRLLDAGAKHLDRGQLTIRGDGEMHLGDRGGGHRLLDEFAEHLLDRLPEIRLDRRPRRRDRKRRQAILERCKVMGNVVAQEIGAGRQALAKLDEGRPHLLQRRGQPLARPALGPLVHEGPREAQERPRLGQQLEGKERVVAGKGPPDPDHPPTMTYARQHRAGPPLEAPARVDRGYAGR